MGHPYFYPEGESDCCGAPSLTPIDSANCGVCSDCKDHAVFSGEE